jgi:PAS domain S-box-containing protein
MCLINIIKLDNKKIERVINTASLLSFALSVACVMLRDVVIISTGFGNQFSYQGSSVFLLMFFYNTLLISAIVFVHILWWKRSDLKGQRKHILILIIMTLVTSPPGFLSDYVLPLFTKYTTVPVACISMLLPGIWVYISTKKYRTYGVTTSNVSQYAFTAVTVPILVLDHKNIICLENKAAVNFYGDSFKGRNITDLILFRGRKPNDMFFNHDIENATITVETPSGDKICDMVLTTERDKYNDAICKIVVLRDITDIEHKDNLLEAVNQAAGILLASHDKDSIEHPLKTSMAFIGHSMNADRIHIWQNKIIDGEMCFSLEYNWINDYAKGKKDVPLGSKFMHKDKPAWIRSFLQNECIGGPVFKMKADDNKFFSTFDIKSVVLIPLFLDEQFWGLFSIDDCEREREFTDDDVSILRSVSLMMASTINRYALVEKRTLELAIQTTTLKTMIDSIPDVLFTKDLDLKYMHCNKAFETHLGHSAKDIIGKKDSDEIGIPYEKALEMNEIDRRVIRENKSFTTEETVPNADGVNLWFESTKIPLLLNNTVVGIVGISRDITQQLEQERKMAADLKHINIQSETLARITTSPTISSGDIKAAADVIAEEACKVLYASRVSIWRLTENNMLINISSYEADSQQHIIQGDYSISGNNKYTELVNTQRLVVINNIKECEALLPLYYGTLCACIDAPIRIDGKLYGIICIEQFISDEYPGMRIWRTGEKNFTSSIADLMALAISGHERRMAKDEATAASQAKSDFLANMSHEIRTPMNVIVGLTELLIEGDVAHESEKEYLQKINTAGVTLTGLINDVLDISKIESGKFDLSPTQYELPSLLNDIVTISIIKIGEKPINFKLELADELFVKFHGDDLRVKQILINLLSNAFKYTRMGTVTLKVDCERDSENAESVMLSFAVIDTGIGMREEDVKKLFTDYSQVDTHANRAIEGTGLGLSIAKGLAELMGGDITVKSEYGKGSTFNLVIKQGFISDEIISGEIAETLRNFRYVDDTRKSGKQLKRPDLSYVKVLVVDDSPTNLDVARGVLGKYKMQVDCVMSGEEAIEKIKSEELIYDAIFMDHMMPGMDGIEAAGLIRALGTEYAEKIPIIALTANAIAGNEQLFLDEGFQAFLTKPISVIKLDYVIRQWIMNSGQLTVDSGQSTENEQPSTVNSQLSTLSIPGINTILGLSLYEDDMEMFVEILQSYAENIPDELEKLKDLTEETIYDYGLNVHTVKGASSSIGAKEITLRAKNLESMAKAGDYSGVKAESDEFIKDAEILVGNIKEWLEKNGL